jgi:uncharacterized membrane protein SpoIIM required for sporulation
MRAANLLASFVLLPTAAVVQLEALLMISRRWDVVQLVALVLSGVFSLFVFGVFAFLVPAVAFAQVGFVATSLAARGGSWLALGADSPLQFLIGYVLPHGIIELPTAILGAALGLRIGASLMSPPKGFSVGRNILWSLAQFFKVWGLVLLPLFLVAALIEGLISPQVIASLYGRKEGPRRQ